MSYPARQCLAKTMQAMVCELFTNFDQKAGRKSITCGASSEKLPAVPISPLLHESNVSAPSKDSLISVFSAAFPRKVFGNADWGSSRTVKIIQRKTERFPAAFKVRNDLLTQGYGIDRAKSSTLLSKSTEAESSADKSPNKKLTSVHSQNSATTEQL